MRVLKKALLIFLTVSFLTGGVYSNGFCWEKWTKNDSITDEWTVMDILIARPLGIAASIFGAGVFVLSLPFTIPTGSVEKTADMLIVKPFHFSFERELPDDDM